MGFKEAKNTLNMPTVWYISWAIGFSIVSQRYQFLIAKFIDLVDLRGWRSYFGF